MLARQALAYYVVPIICLVGVGLRIAAACFVPDQSAILGDAVAYREAGHSLWTTGRLGTAYQMPLYPMLVAVWGPGWPQLLIDVGLSTLMIGLMYELTKLLFAHELTPLLAATITAVYPHFIFFSVIGLTETLFMTLTVAAYVFWYQKRDVLGDVCAVLGILTRPVLDLLAPVLVVCFVLVVHRLPPRIAMAKLGLYAAIYCVLMAPWWLHNCEAYGRFVRLNLGGGLALFSGNNPMNQTGGFDINLGISAAPFYRIADPFARDQAAREAAISYIESNPMNFIRQAFLKFLRFWRPWPYTEHYASPFYVAASLLSFGPVLVLAVLFLPMAGPGQLRRAGPLLLFVIYLTTVYMVFPGSIRYRLPLEPFLIVLAAAGGTSLVTLWRTKQIRTFAG